MTALSREKLLAWLKEKIRKHAQMSHYYTKSVLKQLKEKIEQGTFDLEEGKEK